MAFSQADITYVDPPVQMGTQLLLSWGSTAPSGTTYQVYVDGSLAWSGNSLTATIPLPSGQVQIEIGYVDTNEAQTRFTSSLPPGPQTYATLAWLGGTFESPNIGSFAIYGQATPGGAINYTKPLAQVPAYIAGIITDGFGYGGFGQGGFGEAAASYSWTTPQLTTGTWTFAVVPIDAAGNAGTGRTVSVEIAAPPIEPAPFADGTRLHYSYSASTHECILTWNPSPSAT